MFGWLKSFVSSLLGDARLQKFEDTDCRLATAALLTRVATVNSEMSEARRRKLYAVLKSCFELDDCTTVQLIHDAAAADRSAVDLYHFTRQLNDVLDAEGRQRIVKMMWQIIYVDESVNEFESNIIWRAADLLGVSSRQRIELRQRVAAGKAALNPI
ncbi:MAG: TerB family tellurite resistance protein [Pseudolabrys sp.]